MYRYIFLIMFCMFMSFLAANRVEPAFLNREYVLDTLRTCNLPFYTKHESLVIKPSWGSHNGKGVNIQSLAWNTTICEQQTQGPCFTQVYHPGPWEGRMTKENHVWKTVAWKVPWLDTQTEPPAFETSFPWEEELRKCLDSKLSSTTFLALDFRTNGFDILPLEINGAYGMTYDFVIEKKHIMVELLHWILLRSIYGFYNIDIWIFRLVENIRLWYHKWKTRRVPSRVWF